MSHDAFQFITFRLLPAIKQGNLVAFTSQHFWPADQSQIYRTLTRLVKEGWVEMELIEQTDRPSRKVYHITEAGRVELLRWLAEPTPERASRSAALIQVFFFGQLQDEVILRKFEAYAQSMRKTLAAYEQLSQELTSKLPETCTPREHFFWMSTLDLGIRTTRANIDWVENIIRQLKSGNVPQNERLDNE